MSFDSQRPGLPWSLNQTGTARRPLSSLLSSSKSLIKLSVEDSGTPSVFWPRVHLMLPNNIQSASPRGVQAGIVSLLPISPVWPFHLLVPLTHFIHGYEGLLCLVRCLKSESSSLPPHSLSCSLQPDLMQWSWVLSTCSVWCRSLREKRVWGGLTAYVVFISVHNSAYCVCAMWVIHVRWDYMHLCHIP